MVKFFRSVYFELIWYVLAYVFYYCVLTVVFYPWGVSVAAITAMSLLLALNYIRRKEKKKRGIGFIEVFGLKRVRLSRKDILLLAVLGIALNFTMGGILNILPARVSRSYVESYSVIASGSIYETVIVMAIITPILEEILFRGIFQRKLGEHLGEGFGLIAAACVFGFMHFNIVWSIYSGIIGFLLGAVYLYYGSVLPGAVVHCFFNLVSCVPLLLSKYEKIYRYTFGNKVYVVVSLIVGVVILYLIFDKTWLSKYLKKDFYRKKERGEVSENENA